MSEKSICIIYYDGECPFCSSYVGMVSLRESFDVQLINLREDSDSVALLYSKGYEVNQGMVVVINEEYYYGSEAVWILSRLTTNRTWFSRFVAQILKRKLLSKLIYPLMRLGRRIALFFLGVKLIAIKKDKN